MIEFTAFDLVDKLLTQHTIYAGSESRVHIGKVGNADDALDQKICCIVEGANHFDMYDKRTLYHKQ